MATNQEDLHGERERNQKKMRNFRNFFDKTLLLAEAKALDET